MTIESIEAHLEAYLLSRRNAKRAARTVDWYARHIGHWVRWLAATGNLADWLGADALDAYLAAERLRGLADRSVKSRFDCIRAFLRWLRKRRRIAVAMDDLPTAIVEPPEVKASKPRQADYEDLQRVISSIFDDDWLDYRDRCILTLMLATGLRVDETISVRVRDIDLRAGFVFVEAGKGEKSRQVPFDGQFKAAFVNWIYNRPATANSLLFMRSDRWKHPLGAAISGATVRMMLKRRCVVAGVKYINPHSIRHLFASKALNNGVALSAVSTMLGHESVAFTAKVYAKWVQTGLRKEYDDNWKVKNK
jgi:integrase/recombinase XerD